MRNKTNPNWEDRAHHLEGVVVAFLLLLITAISGAEFILMKGAHLAKWLKWPSVMGPGTRPEAETIEEVLGMDDRKSPSPGKDKAGRPKAPQRRKKHASEPDTAPSHLIPIPQFYLLRAGSRPLMHYIDARADLVLAPFSFTNGSHSI